MSEYKNEENAEYLVFLREKHEEEEERFREESKNSKFIRKKIKESTDEELMVYVPKVYQRDIYSIDYLRLKEKGVKLISFDIDDTIYDSVLNKARGLLPGIKVTMPGEARYLFKYLKKLGFTVVLLTNTRENIAKDVCDSLDADGYIAKANKPETLGFEKLMQKYSVSASEMAHVGNSMRDDMVGGNRAGVTTCYIRRNGFVIKTGKIAKNAVQIKTVGQNIREELLERNIWRKHHMYFSGDQYYQLGETPKYRQAGDLKENN